MSVKTFEVHSAVARLLGCCRTHEDGAIHLLHSCSSMEVEELLNIAAAAHACATESYGPAGQLVDSLRSAAHSSNTACSIPVVSIVLTPHTVQAVVLTAVQKAAAAGSWVVLLSAHNSPAVLHSVIQMTRAYVDAQRTHPTFRLFLYCPTQQLHRVTVRPLTWSVQLGADRSLSARTLSTLHALSTRAAAPLDIFRASETPDLIMATAIVLQTLCMGLCLAWSAAAQLPLDAAGLASHPAPRSSLRQLRHSASALRHLLQLAPDAQRLDFDQLRSAVLQVRVPHSVQLL